MIVTDRKSELDRLLLTAAQTLDLTETEYGQAKSRYQAVGDWLGAAASPLYHYNTNVYVQGSFLLGTCVRPFGRKEFDIDLVCQLEVPDHMSQRDVKDLVGRRLKEHATYRRMLKEKNRCWQIVYAGEFHLDVLPAKPDEHGATATAVLVPDSELSRWKASDPKGYAHWFAEEKARSRYEAVHGAGTRFLERAGVEPVPPKERPFQKTPLQFAVQLLKCHRDIHFQGSQNAPISMIITTLAGHSYEGQGDILSTMEHVLESMPTYVEYENGVAYVRNPVNPEENFAEKWQKHPERRQAFDDWNAKAISDLRLLRESGLQNLIDPLSRFLGEDRADAAYHRFANTITEQRGRGLMVDPTTGLLAAGTPWAIPVRKNTFFGGRV